MAEKDERLLTGGLDFDTEDHKLGSEDYRDALNLRNGVGAAGKFNLVTLNKGNELISFSLSPGIDKKTIGTYEAKDLNAIIYFIWAGDNNDAILIYYDETGTIELLMQTDFGWEKDEYITGVALVDNSLLYWTDNVMPRKINIEKAVTAGKLFSYNYFEYSGGPLESIIVRDPLGNIVLNEKFNVGNRIVVVPNIDTYITQTQCSENEVGMVFNTGYEEYTLEITRFGKLNLLVRNNHYVDGADLTEWHHALIKTPPHCPVTTEYKKDDDFDFDHVNQKLFQYRMKYVFDDEESSRWGPISKLAFNAPYIERSLPQNPLPNPEFNKYRDFNYIEVDATNLQISNLAKLNTLREVHIAYRLGNDDPDWKRYVVLERVDFWRENLFIILDDDSGTILSRFYNDNKPIFISEKETTPLSDSVPKLANGLDFVENRIFLGGVTEGDNTPCVRAGITVQENPVDFITEVTPLVKSEYKWGAHHIFGLVYFDFAGRSTTVGSEPRLEVKVPHINEYWGNFGNTPGVPHFFKYDRWGNKRPFNLHWAIDSDSEIPLDAVTYQWVRTRNLAYEKWLWFIINGVRTIQKWDRDGTDSSALLPNGVNTQDSSGKQYRISLDSITFSNREDTNTLKYTFEEGDRIRLLWGNKALVFTLTTGWRRIFGDPAFEQKWDFALSEYIVQEDWSPASTATESRNDVVIDIGNFDIYDETFSIDDLKVGNSQYFPLLSDALTLSDLVGVKAELYNPGKIATDDEGNISERFFEIGECYPILNAGTATRSHSKTSGIMTGGDSYLRYRTYLINPSWPNTVDDLVNSFGNVKNTFGFDNGEMVQAMDISDNYPSVGSDIGRVHIQDARARRLVRGDLVRFSNLFIPDSKVNGLSTFESSNQAPVDRKFGDIRKLLGVRNVLLVIQDHKTGSYTINEQLFTSAEGVDTVALADRVMGSYRVFKQDLGTQHPESVKEYNGSAWAYDAYKNEFWRYAQDGQTVISDYFAKSFFNEISKIINSSPNRVSVTTEVDTYYDEVLVTFRKGFSGSYITGQRRDIINTQDVRDWIKVNDIINISEDTWVKVELISVDGTELEVTTVLGSAATPEGEKIDLYAGKTIVFNELKNRWTTRKSFVPEFYGRVGQKIASFIRGGFWMHDKNEIRGNFYGIQYPAQIKVISNIEPGAVKIWMNIEEQATSAWHIPEIKTPKGQLSRILLSKFKNEEDVFKAEFLRDINTPNESNPIMNGDVLRSETIELLLQNNLTTHEELTAVKVYSIISKLVNE